MPFEFERLKIEDVILVTPRVFEDDRGFFLETYKKSEFARGGIDIDIKQDNRSRSQKGVLRGLHYQAYPMAQAKIVSCTLGEILDVAVDIRKNSPTFGQWVSAKLSEKNKKSLYLPVGFAHGFVALTDWVELSYKCSEEYSPAHDRGIYWADKDINVDWGIDFEPILSEKDKKQPLFKDIKELL